MRCRSRLGHVLGSQKDLSCVFESGTNGTVAKYTGDVTKLGIDIGYTNAGVLVWAVVAPSKDMRPTHSKAPMAARRLAPRPLSAAISMC